MIVQSTRFGPIDVAENTVLRFGGGLPGFEALKRFVMVICDQTEPIRWLQAVDDEAVSLPIIDPFIICPDYKVDIDEAEFEVLGDKDEKNLVVFCVMVIPTLKSCTVNLSAPVVINVVTNNAKQLLIDYNLQNALRYPAYDGLVKYYKEMEASASIDAQGR